MSWRMGAPGVTSTLGTPDRAESLRVLHTLPQPSPPPSHLLLACFSLNSLINPFLREKKVQIGEERPTTGAFPKGVQQPGPAGPSPSPCWDTRSPALLLYLENPVATLKSQGNANKPKTRPGTSFPFLSTVKILPPLNTPIPGHSPWRHGAWRGEGWHTCGDEALQAAGKSWAPHNSLHRPVSPAAQGSP